MKISVKKEIGKATFIFSIDEANEMEALHKAAVLGNPREYCSECKNNQFFSLVSNKDKEGNIYVNVLCKKCGAKSKLGRYKTNGYFWRSFEKYEGNSKDQVKQEFEGTEVI